MFGLYVLTFELNSYTWILFWNVRTDFMSTVGYSWLSMHLYKRVDATLSGVRGGVGGNYLTLFHSLW